MFLVIQILFNALLIRCALACPNSKLLWKGVTAEDKEIILDVHNRYRQAISLGRIRGQPSATNMLEMTWDEELATMAQNWANQCEFRHDPDLGTASARFPVGQNLAKSWSEPVPNQYGESAEWASQIRNWFNELYLYGRNDYLNSGHFTQVIWGDSHLLGCGYLYYKNQRRYVKLYVCNYGPGGNIIGRPAYKKGPPVCERRDLRPSSGYLGLCEVVDNAAD
uniref:Putative scp-like extracellular protein n=1 Tax=Panstrongylus lignarius TaxID=156445 RepID=A0A224XJN9_9HEMI